MLEHGLCFPNFPVIHDARSSVPASLLVGGGQPGFGVLHDYLALEVVEGGGYVNELSAFGCAD
jgi:hypothetical protein